MENKTITIKELAQKYGVRVDLLRLRMSRGVFAKYRAPGSKYNFKDIPKLYEQIASTMKIYEVKDAKRNARKKNRDNVYNMYLQEMGA